MATPILLIRTRFCGIQIQNPLLSSVAVQVRLPVPFYENQPTRVGFYVWNSSEGRTAPDCYLQ